MALVGGLRVGQAGALGRADGAGVVDSVERHPRRQLVHRVAVRPPGFGSDVRHDTAPTSSTSFLEPRSDHRASRAPLAEAGVRDARLHDARHAATSLLLLQGVAPRVAMEVLGC